MVLLYKGHLKAINKLMNGNKQMLFTLMAN